MKTSHLHFTGPMELEKNIRKNKILPHCWRRCGLPGAWCCTPRSCKWSWRLCYCREARARRRREGIRRCGRFSRWSRLRNRSPWAPGSPVWTWSLFPLASPAPPPSSESSLPRFANPPQSLQKRIHISSCQMLLLWSSSMQAQRELMKISRNLWSQRPNGN